MADAPPSEWTGMPNVLNELWVRLAIDHQNLVVAYDARRRGRARKLVVPTDATVARMIIAGRHGLSTADVMTRTAPESELSAEFEAMSKNVRRVTDGELHFKRVWLKEIAAAVGMTDSARDALRSTFDAMTTKCSLERRVIEDALAEHQVRAGRTGSRVSKPKSNSGSILSRDDFYADLFKLYDQLRNSCLQLTPMEFAGESTSIWAVPATAHDDLEAVLGEISGSDPERRAWSADFNDACEEDYWNDCKKPETPLQFDGPLYAMNTMTPTADGLVIDCRPSRFYQAQATSWSLSREYIKYFAGHDGRVPSLRDLPFRAWLHEHVENPILDGSNRSAEVSVSTLVLCRTHEGAWEMLVSPRSAMMSSEAFQYHVVPSGKFSPTNPPSRLGQGFNVRENIYRELLEECFGYEEKLHRDYGHVSVRLRSYAEIQRLERMMDANEAELYRTGVAVNLLNLQPEICTLLIIHDPEWTSLPNMVLNSEYLIDGPEVPKGVKIVRSIPLDEDLQLVPDATVVLTRENTVPVGMACINMGLDLARRVLCPMTFSDHPS